LKALQKGFTLVEMLIAASIACIFLISAMDVFVNIGKFFEIADSQALKTERSVIYYETFTKIASKRFIPKQYIFIDQKGRQVIGLKFPIQFIDVPKFARLGSPNGWVPSLIDLQLLDLSSPGAKYTMSVVGHYVWYKKDDNLKDGRPLNLILASVKEFPPVKKNLYLKPVYVNEYKYGRDRGSGWDRGDLLPFDEKIFDELVQEKKKGNVSRIYLVVK
jgi:prepilin-type N-terminal cleavage/methylation domain-containing protein